MFQSDAEGAFDRGRMKVHRYHSANACCPQQIGYQPSSNRLLPARISILTRVPEVRRNGSYVICSGTPARIGKEKQLHYISIQRRPGGLNEEDVARSHVLTDLHVQFAVGRSLEYSLPKRSSEYGGHRLGKRGIVRTGKDR